MKVEGSITSHSAIKQDIIQVQLLFDQLTLAQISSSVFHIEEPILIINQL